jgi:DNA-binding beta-propeller fold protein YncE
VREQHTIRQDRRGSRIAVVLVAGVVLAFAAAPAALSADRVYWANGNNTISYANLDGSGGGQLDISGATPNGTRGVDIDPVGGRIYFTNFLNHTISYANLDGSGGGGQLDLSGAPIFKPFGIAIDQATRRIYWGNEVDNAISWASLDGSAGGTLNTTGATPAEPYGVAIDTAERKIYWANRDNDTISYAKLDGSGGGGEVDIAGASTDKPHGVTIDPVARKVYWTNLGNTISYANLDGPGGGADLNHSGGEPGGPIGMAIDPTAGRIWWANLGNHKISYVALDGSGVGGTLDIAGATSSQPRFLALLQTPRADGTPAISGESALGSVLSCNPPSWLPDVPDGFLYRAPLGVDYQWSRDGVDIAGGSGSAYRAFATGAYRCRVTASNRAGETSLTSAPHTVVGPVGTIGGEGVGDGAGPGLSQLAALARFTGSLQQPPSPAPAGASFAGSESVITIDRGGGFRFTFHARGAQRGRATVASVRRVRVSRGSNRRKRIALARMTFAVPPDGEVTLGARLSKANLRALRLNRTIPARIGVVLTNAAGQSTTASRTIELRAPRPPAR